MFLRSLTLKGFKSFAEATTIELEPGVTAVVGPNGSGKSNVVDAVAWVLGATSPSVVRSGRMDDVIFAGNSRRQALGRAEVSLTIDNASGLLPIGFAEVTITRTLFRSSGESEYAINGAPARLLDVQELLSDSGVGRHQHVIVSQGHLDAVLDARPEERRLIVEEAAGILKYRRRKEKAERRLVSTEANLVRLTDVTREVNRQIRPLERQAAAAQCHSSLAGELRQLRLYLAGRELVALMARRDAAVAAGAGFLADGAGIDAELEVIDGEITAVEETLRAAGNGSVDATMGRLEAVRERARGLTAVIEERTRSTLRERAQCLATADSAAVVALEQEEAALGAVDEATRSASAALEAAGAALDAQEASLGPPGGTRRAGLSVLRAADTDDSGSGLAATSVEPRNQGDRPGAAQVRGELRTLETALGRESADLARLDARLQSLRDRSDRLRTAREAAAAGEARVAEQEARLREALAGARIENEALVSAAASAAEAWQAARAAHESAKSRLDALAMALDQAQPDLARAPQAASLGALMVHVEVEPGWEAAFEAVVADAETTLLSETVEQARRLLDNHDSATMPTVLVLSNRDLTVGTEAISGAMSPSGLRRRVAPQPGRLAEPLGRLLDRLLADVDAVDASWSQALDAYLANPSRIVVTPAGDRFAASGWRVGGRGRHAARRAMAQATAAASEAAHAVTTTNERYRSAASILSQGQDKESHLKTQFDAATAQLAAATMAQAKFEADSRALNVEVAGIAEQRDALRARQRADKERVADLVQVLALLEATEAGDRRSREAAAAAQKEYQAGLDSLVARRRNLELEAAALAERANAVAQTRASLRARRAALVDAATTASQRLVTLDVLTTRLNTLDESARTAIASIEEALADLRLRRRAERDERSRLVDVLVALRGRRQATEERMEAGREHLRRAQIDEAEATVRLEAAAEALRQDADCEPSVAVNVECPELPEGATAAGRLRDLDRELRLLGPVNPLAIEELAVLSERSAFLAEQLGDVKASRRELSKVITAVEDSIRELLSSALADVTMHFDALFATLFPGGSGTLRLTDPGDALESGIEIEARPAGKNVRRLSLLSGGERSLCALAFLFAVFRSRPSPFYLLDEVEASLDDVNLHRFLDLLGEFRQEAQFLVVTHQKLTMDAADALHGITMAPGGTSKVVSERLRVAPGSPESVSIS